MKFIGYFFLLLFFLINVFVFFLVQYSGKFESFILRDSILKKKEQADDLFNYLPNKYRSEGSLFNKDVSMKGSGGSKLSGGDFVKMYSGYWVLRIPPFATQESVVKAVKNLEIAESDFGLNYCILSGSNFEGSIPGVQIGEIFFVQGKICDSEFEMEIEPYVFRISEKGKLVGINTANLLKNSVFTSND